jgi:hypothetical protein
MNRAKVRRHYAEQKAATKEKQPRRKRRTNKEGQR